ncbi:Alpha-L-fucosidase [Anaerohalosphaera lusitana]|uniref:alpha-L-fucosidase n=1 Tax=Anaerohalosphaera lusitana TaxID=1936003 RepID=A0A1U9NQ82_9BACT|nr:alpha-L-fucosidase [Anaerohalosphaera lusitana]AQT69878.1 Alpha-L-fucosidase [Anaerohalosphaera lusitana]
MKKSYEKKCLLILVVVSLASLALAGEKTVPGYLEDHAKLYAENPRQANFKWFDQARMGLFIHWGVWGPYEAEWQMFYSRIPLEEYKKTAARFTGKDFDAEEIVKFARASGMNYITFVAKHHDGFCLWDSAYTDWDSMDYQAKRDFLGELAQACHAEDMPLFIYYSIGIDWTHPYFMPSNLYGCARPHYKAKPDYFRYAKEEDFEIYRQFCKNQLSELCEKYGPVAGFWFDTLGGVLANPEMFKMQEFYDLIHEHQPHALIGFKTGATGTEDFLIGERHLGSIAGAYPGNSPENRRIRKLADEAWSKNYGKKAEICVTSTGSWAWRKNAKCWSPAKLWRMLESASDNNANLLLNTGLDIDGGIPDDARKNFQALGDRIRKEGYPKLNKTTYLQKRKTEEVVDDNEKVKTAR